MSTLRNGVFSGKLSPVMTHSEESAQGEQPGAAPGPVPEPLHAQLRTPPGTLAPAPREVGGREGPEPTRFGDWELRGRCIDF
jgi:hypothetical protein